MKYLDDMLDYMWEEYGFSKRPPDPFDSWLQFFLIWALLILLIIGWLVVWYSIAWGFLQQDIATTILGAVGLGSYGALVIAIINS